LPKFPLFTGKELCKIIERFGFIYSHTTGSHRVYKHHDGRIVVIPCHSGEQLGPGLINKIIRKDLGILKEEFLEKI